MVSKKDLTPEAYERQIAGLRKHKLKPKSKEARTAQVSVRVEPDVYEKLKQVPNWKELMRVKIYELTDAPATTVAFEISSDDLLELEKIPDWETKLKQTVFDMLAENTERDRA